MKNSSKISNGVKKILILIIFVFFFFPLISIADIHGPNECCKLEHDFLDVSDECYSGEVVGPAYPKFCESTITATTSQWATCCFLDSIYTISDWVGMAFFAFALITFAIGAYHFLFAGGDPKRIETAKNYFFWGSIGVILFLFSKLIPGIIKAIVA